MNMIPRIWICALPVGLLAACAGDPPTPVRPATDFDRELVEFRLTDHDDRVLIQCRPVALDVGPEWVDDCNRKAEQALIEARAEGRAIEIPDPPFGMASEAMRNGWETIRQSGALETIVLTREIERIQMI